MMTARERWRDGARWTEDTKREQSLAKLSRLLNVVPCVNIKKRAS